MAQAWQPESLPLLGPQVFFYLSCSTSLVWVPNSFVKSRLCDAGLSDACPTEDFLFPVPVSDIGSCPPLSAIKLCGGTDCWEGREGGSPAVFHVCLQRRLLSWVLVPIPVLHPAGFRAALPWAPAFRLSPLGLLFAP